MGDASTQRSLVVPIFKLGRTGDPARTGFDKVFLIANCGDRQFFGQAIASIEAELFGTDLALVGLADAKAARLAPIIGQQVELGSMMFGFEQHG